MIMAFQRAVFFILAVLIAASSARYAFFDISSSEENNNDMDLISEVRSACFEKTGSNETFDRLIAAVENAVVCLEGKLDTDEFARDIENLTSSNRVEFFTTYCPQLRDSINCLSPITDEFRKCVDEDELEMIDIIINLLPEAVGLVCKNHGAIIFVADSNENECIDNIIDYIDTCMDGTLSNATLTMGTSSYGQAQCGEVAKVRQCLVTKMNDCKSPRLMDIFDLFYRPLIKSTPCKHYIVLDEIATIDSNDI